MGRVGRMAALVVMVGALLLTACTSSSDDLTSFEKFKCSEQLAHSDALIELRANDQELQTYTQWMTSEAGIASVAVTQAELWAGVGGGGLLTPEYVEALAVFRDTFGTDTEMAAAYLETPDGTRACRLYVDEVLRP